MQTSIVHLGLNLALLFTFCQTSFSGTNQPKWETLVKFSAKDETGKNGNSASTAESSGALESFTSLVSAAGAAVEAVANGASVGDLKGTKLGLKLAGNEGSYKSLTLTGEATIEFSRNLNPPSGTKSPFDLIDKVRISKVVDGKTEEAIFSMSELKSHPINISAGKSGSFIEPFAQFEVLDSGQFIIRYKTYKSDSDKTGVYSTPATYDIDLQGGTLKDPANQKIVKAIKLPFTMSGKLLKTRIAFSKPINTYQTEPANVANNTQAAIQDSQVSELPLKVAQAAGYTGVKSSETSASLSSAAAK